MAETHLRLVFHVDVKTAKHVEESRQLFARVGLTLGQVIDLTTNQQLSSRDVAALAELERSTGEAETFDAGTPEELPF